MKIRQETNRDRDHKINRDMVPCMSGAQKGIGRNTRGAMEQLLVNRTEQDQTEQPPVTLGLITKKLMTRCSTPECSNA